MPILEKPAAEPDAARPRWRRWLRPSRLAVALLALGLTWRAVRYGLAFPIWGDEAFLAVNFLLRDFAGLVRPLVWGQIAPLGFTWSELAVVRLLGPGEHALRLVPFVAGCASLLLFWRLARRVLPLRAAVLALGMLASSYFAVRHGAEVKPYSTDLFIALVLITLGWRTYHRPTGRTSWTMLSVAVALAPWLSYPAIFIGCGIVPVLVWRVILAARDGHPARAAIAGCIGMTAALFLSFAWMYVSYARPHAAAAAGLAETQMWRQTFPPVTDPWGLLVWAYGVHTGNLFAYPVGGRAPGSIVTFVLAVIGGVVLWRRNRPLLWMLILPFGATFVAAALHKYPYGGSVRTSIYLAPAICLCSGLGLFAVLRAMPRLRRSSVARGERLPEHGAGDVLRFARRPRRTRYRVPTAITVPIVVFVLGVISVVGMLKDIREPYKSGDVYLSQLAIREVVRATGGDDQWVVFNAVEPVEHAPWLGDWAGTGGQFVFDVVRFAPVPVSWAPAPAGLKAPRSGRVWLLVYRGVKVETFPEAQLQVYLDVLSIALGPPTYERTVLKRRGSRIEAIDVYGFGRRTS